MGSAEPMEPMLTQSLAKYSIECWLVVYLLLFSVLLGNLLSNDLVPFLVCSCKGWLDKAALFFALKNPLFGLYSDFLPFLYLCLQS